VKLAVDSDDAALLRDTVDEFLWAANSVVDHAWEGDYKTTSKAQLQAETYDEVRDQTRLHANLVQNARNKAADAVQSVVARWKQGEYAGKPHFSKPTAVYDKRCATFHDEYVSLATVGGRIEVEYVLPDEERDTPHSRYLDNDDYEERVQNSTTRTAGGTFISAQRRRWSLKRRNRQRPGTAQSSALTSA
jgi:hypothetical protein